MLCLAIYDCLIGILSGMKDMSGDEASNLGIAPAGQISAL